MLFSFILIDFLELRVNLTRTMIFHYIFQIINFLFLKTVRHKGIDHFSFHKILIK